MDLDNENILKLIYTDIDNLKDNFECSLYLNKIGSLKIDKLAKEPSRLNDEKCIVNEQTQNLAFNNCKTFIQTAECSRQIVNKFDKAEDLIQSMKEELPKLSDLCENFVDASRQLNNQRRLNSLTLTHNAQLLEILEIPQLMETFIKNDGFEEALELAAYVRRLASKHGHIPLINSLINDVEKDWIAMYNQLLSQLKTDLQLPKCLQVVGYLRRMEQFTDNQLRLKFLQARGTWLNGLLNAVPKHDVNYYLVKIIEVTRIHLFNIATQYNAIFSDDEPILLLNKIENMQSNIFYNWIIDMVANFLHTLKESLNRVSGIISSYDSIMEQSMYFGLAFSRIGLDFRPQLALIFEENITEFMKQTLRSVTKQFDLDMDSYVLPKKEIVYKNNSSIISSNQENINQNNSHPPENLLLFPPLANLLNGIVGAYNEIRQCAPISIATNVTTALEHTLSSCVFTILGFYRREQQAFTPIEKANAFSLCAAFAYDLIPHIQLVHQTLFPHEMVNSLFKINGKQTITNLNSTEILDPISHLLPIKINKITTTNN